MLEYVLLSVYNTDIYDKEIYQLLSNKLILLQASAKETGANPSFIQIESLTNPSFILKKN